MSCPRCEARLELSREQDLFCPMCGYVLYTHQSQEYSAWTRFAPEQHRTKGSVGARQRRASDPMKGV